jgi:hypothetical protein
MPVETTAAIQWAMMQDGVVIEGAIDHHALVDAVCEYFATHSVVYTTFSYDDLRPHLAL